MRIIPTLAACVLTAVPLITLGPPARADDNGFVGQAQRFLNNNNGNDSRDAYERGRDDEMRRQQAQQNRDDRYRRDDDRAYSRDDRYRDQNTGYNNSYR